MATIRKNMVFDNESLYFCSFIGETRIEGGIDIKIRQFQTGKNSIQQIVGSSEKFQPISSQDPPSHYRTTFSARLLL